LNAGQVKLRRWLCRFNPLNKMPLAWQLQAALLCQPLAPAWGSACLIPDYYGLA
jgi:hypothetical protein